MKNGHLVTEKKSFSKNKGARAEEMGPESGGKAPSGWSYTSFLGPSLGGPVHKTELC